MDLKLTKNFHMCEFMPKNIYEKFGKNCTWFLDPRVPLICQYLRDVLARRVTVNTWKFDNLKIYDQSGFRQNDSPIGAVHSQHKFGRAADIKIDGMHPEDVRQFIRKEFKNLSVLGLSTIEKHTPTWVHFDVRDTGLDEIFEVEYA